LAEVKVRVNGLSACLLAPAYLLPLWRRLWLRHCVFVC